LAGIPGGTVGNLAKSQKFVQFLLGQKRSYIAPPQCEVLGYGVERRDIHTGLVEKRKGLGNKSKKGGNKNKRFHFIKQSTLKMFLHSAPRDRGTEWDEIQRRLGNKAQLEEDEDADDGEIDYGHSIKSKSEKLKEQLREKNASYEEVKEHEDDIDDDDFFEEYRCQPPPPTIFYCW
jgi:hypothetical protein